MSIEREPDDVTMPRAVGERLYWAIINLPHNLGSELCEAIEEFHRYVRVRSGGATGALGELREQAWDELNILLRRLRWGCPPESSKKASEPQRCPVKHPAFESAQCCLDAGHEGPHNMEGARNQRWKAAPPEPSEEAIQAGVAARSDGHEGRREAVIAVLRAAYAIDWRGGAAGEASPDNHTKCPTCGCEAPHKVLAELNAMVESLRAQIPNQRAVEEAYRKASEVSQKSMGYEVRGHAPVEEGKPE